MIAAVPGAVLLYVSCVDFFAGHGLELFIFVGAAFANGASSGFPLDLLITSSERDWSRSPSLPHSPSACLVWFCSIFSTRHWQEKRLGSGGQPGRAGKPVRAATPTGARVRYARRGVSARTLACSFRSSGVAVRWVRSGWRYVATGTRSTPRTLRAR